MTDREKVIKGFECHMKGDCVECPYREGWHTCNPTPENGLFADALALLKAQEPRVMTLDEALNGLVIEYRSGKLQVIGKLVFTEGFEYYGDIWRVWDKMPTDEQRQAVKWE